VKKLSGFVFEDLRFSRTKVTSDLSSFGDGSLEDSTISIRMVRWMEIHDLKVS
jgi:hypothetical protein